MKGRRRGLMQPRQLQAIEVEKSTRGDGMRRRAIGAALLIVGGLAVLFAPWHLDAVSDSSGPFGSESRLDLIYWPPGWYWVHLPMLIIGSRVRGDRTHSREHKARTQEVAGRLTWLRRFRSLGRGSGHLAVHCATPGCTSTWYKPRHSRAD
jgi:hypothetical protein